MDERVGRLGLMVLEDRIDGRADRDLALGRGHEVADHADPVRVGELDEDDHVGAGLGEHRVDGMMRALPAVDPRLARNGRELEIEGMAAVAEMFGGPLPGAAGGA